MRRLSLVIPCFNEERRFQPAAFREFLDQHDDVELVLVDDGSTDGTLRFLDGLEASAPDRVSVLALPLNQGKAEAVRQGILRSLDAGGQYVGYWDADLATPLEAALYFCDRLDRRPELEMIYGSRVQLLGRTIQGSKLRHYLGRLCASVAAEMLELPVYDSQCGAKVFRVMPSLKEVFAERFRTRWIFDVEILARLIAQRRGTDLPQPEEVVFEVPLQVWRDVPGSKINATSYVSSAVDAWRLWRAYPLRPRLRRSVR